MVFIFQEVTAVTRREHLKVSFVADHLRDVAETILTDLRNIGCLPDKLHSGQAGDQVAWALLAKTLPPRVIHLLRAHPVSETAELTDILQEGLQDTVRQLLGVPFHYS